MKKKVRVNESKSLKIDEVLKLDKVLVVTKNKWLYPTDNFGKMEKGVVKD